MNKELFWKGKRLTTYADLIGAVKDCETLEEAQVFLHLYESVNPNARHNVGYMIGDVDRHAGMRIIEWFGCIHPVFGTKFPTTEEALRAGIKMGEAVAKYGVEKAMEICGIETGFKNPAADNPWFVGATDEFARKFDKAMTDVLEKPK